MLTRRALVAGGLAAVGGCAVARAEDALSAAVLAITHAAPKSLDGIAMTGPDGPVHLTDFRGRLVILNLWASWCLPCRREMPSLSRLAGVLTGKPVVVLPLSFDRRGLEAVTEFYAELGLTNLPRLAGDTANLQAVNVGPGLPATLVIDAAGLMRWSVTGEATWDDADTLRWLSALLPAA